MMGFSDEVCLLQPGMSIGDYQIVAFINKGTVGEVYEAQCEKTKRQVALKIIPRSMDEKVGENLFLRECSRQKRLREHPNIAAPMAMGHESMLFWFQTEFFVPQVAPDGAEVTTLEDYLRLRGTKLTPFETAFYLYQILEALSFAHEANVAHENLKPDNIFFAGDGLKVTDFALSRLVGRGWDDFGLDTSEVEEVGLHNLDEVSLFTKSLPAMLASFDLWSPEQRKRQEVTVRSDLYNVGSIAVRMLTGQHRIGGRRLNEVDSNIQPEWDQWLEKALAYDPADRFANAAEMLAALPNLENLEVVESAQGEEAEAADTSSFAIEEVESKAPQTITESSGDSSTKGTPEAPQKESLKETVEAGAEDDVTRAGKAASGEASHGAYSDEATEPSGGATEVTSDEPVQETETETTRRKPLVVASEDEEESEGSDANSGTRFRVVHGAKVFKMKR